MKKEFAVISESLNPGTCEIFQSFCTETDNECQRNFLTEVYNMIFVSEEKQQGV
jgi:hypothetical protein